MPAYQNVKFLASYPTASAVLPSVLPEVSFVGRSNVGKSSLMNKIFGRKRLVKVSSTPGKTRALNFFDAHDCYFVDLPGYGFAQVSKSERSAWREAIEGYFEQSRRFALVCALIDIRHDASKLDIQMVEYLAGRNLPFCLVFTKADKLSKAQQQRQVSSLCKQFASAGDAIVLVTSSQTGQGIDDVRALIADAVASEGQIPTER